jgi:acetyl esterase/lipase
VQAQYSTCFSNLTSALVGNIALRGLSLYGGGDLPPPCVVVIAYTGQSTYSSNFPPVFILVSADDPIANIATVERRVHRLTRAGVEVEYHGYRSAGHGFGLGVGTDAEGWIANALRFWNNHYLRRAEA